MKYLTKIIILSSSIVSLFAASLLHAEPSVLPGPLEAGWKGAPVCEKLHEDSQQRVLRCTFPPGVGHERHYHAPNFGYAISGGLVQITDKNGVRKVELQTGSNRMSIGLQWHEIINIGKTTIVYLIVEPKQAT